MKKLIILSTILMSGLGFNAAHAQVGIRVNVNLGGGPVYVPAPPPQQVIINEPVYDDYYYLPEVEAYYSVGERCYYYNDGAQWISAAYLPGYYRNYDWRTARRYEVRANRPYLRHNAYRGRFGGYTDRSDFYARAFPNRGREQYNDRNREQYGNRGGWDRRDDRNDNRGRNQGNYGQPNRGGDRYDQPNRNQGNYGQPDRGRGGNDQQDRGRGNDNRGNNNGNGQPARNMGGGSNGDHFAANRMDAGQDRGGFGRPVRQ